MTRKGESKYKQCGLYAFNSAELTMFYNMPKKEEMLRKHENIEIMRFVEMGYPVQMVEIEGGPEVDVPEDIAIVEQYLQQKVGE
jgi:3-deoxy-manno-octulosonate cytidylyltransferase (CMP-KDO synthetase)